MSVTVERYTPQNKVQWDLFIDSYALNSTFLHTRRFFEHNTFNNINDASLMFYKKNKLIAVFPAIIYKASSKRYLHSHGRATYGGYVVSREVNVEAALQMVQYTIDFAKANSIDEIIIRNPFRIFNRALCDETDYAMWYHGFKIKHRELEIAISLEGNIDDIKSRYYNTTQRNVKKASKLVEVGISNDIKSYWDLLEKCLQERHGQRPVHDYESICALISNVGKENVILFAAHHDSQMVAGILIFKFQNLALHAQYIASDNQYQDLRPVNGVVDCIIEWGNKHGFKYLNLGMANENEGKDINPGLFYFKESFGGRAVLRETMFLEI